MDTPQQPQPSNGNKNDDAVQPAPAPPTADTPAAAAVPASGDPSPSSQQAPKRAKAHTKTPLQREALEMAYKINTTPAQEVMQALAEKLGLTYEQVKSWFSRRRSKDRQEAEKAKLQQVLAERRAAETEGTGDAQGNSTPTATPAATTSTAAAAATNAATPQRGAPPSSTNSPAGAAAASPLTANDLMLDNTGAYGQWAEFADLLAKAKQTLAEPYREDGPRLGYEFDPPPSAADRDAAQKRKRLMLDGFEAELEDDGEMQIRKRRLGEASAVARLLRGTELDAETQRLLSLQQHTESAVAKEQERLNERFLKERDRELERLAKEQMRLAEKVEREQSKEMMRLVRENERKRQMDEREQARIEAKLERMQKQEDKKREREEKKKEREMMRALNQHNKAATRLRNRESHAGPPDDLDIEWEHLVSLRNATGYGSDTDGNAAATTTDNSHAEPMDVERPPFPPPFVALQPAFPPEIDQSTGTALLSVWSFLHSFPELLGLVPCSFEALAGAMVQGRGSALLGRIHVALLRLLQADMEEAHAHGLVLGSAVAASAERAPCAITLEEAWVWGFPVDAWRAHITAISWPEVLREFLLASGMGCLRPRAGKEPKPGESDTLILKMPVNFQPKTTNAAVWTVLSEVGKEGLTVPEITKRILDRGLHPLTGRTPEHTVAGTLSRLPMFVRVASSTYALQPVIQHEKRKAARAAKAAQEAAKAAAAATAAHAAGEGGEGGKAHGGDQSDDEHAAEHAVGDAETQQQGLPWITELLTKDYGDLSLGTRVDILTTLVQLALDSPSARIIMEERVAAAARIRKQMWEEARADKKRQKEEAEARAVAEAKRLIENPNQPLDQSTAPKPEEDVAEIKRRVKERNETVRKAEEANAIRVEPLGLDRRHNRYWRFSGERVPGGDTTKGRIYLERGDTGELQLLDTSEALEALMGVLFQAGAREGPLYKNLLLHKAEFHSIMPQGPLQPVEEAPQVYDAWVWQDALHARRVQRGGDVGAVPSQPYRAGDGPEMTRIKADMLRVYAALPPNGLTAPLDSWPATVQHAPDARALRDCLGSLEASISDDVLSGEFHRNPLLVKGAWMPTGREVASAVPGVLTGQPLPLADSEERPVPEPGTDPDAPLSWLPPTLAAVAFRLYTLDAALLYDPDQLPAREQLLTYCYIQRPALPAAVAKELCAEPAADPAAAAAAVAASAPSSDASATAHAQHTLHIMVGPALAGDGRAIVNRLPPLPHSVLVDDAVAFAVDEERLQQSAPKAAGGGGRPPAGPSMASAPGGASTTAGGGVSRGSSMPRLASTTTAGEEYDDDGGASDRGTTPGHGADSEAAPMSEDDE